MEILGLPNELIDDIKDIIEESYMNGVVSGISRCTVFRDGQKVVLPFEKPLHEYVEDLEAHFGRKYIAYKSRI